MLDRRALAEKDVFNVRAAMAEPTPIVDGIIYRYIIYNEETYFAYACAPSRPLCLLLFMLPPCSP